MKRVLTLGFLIGLVASTLALAADKSQPRLDRTNLLQYRDANREVLQGDTIADWQKRRAEILHGMQEVMGALPGKEKRAPLEMKVQEETDCGGYVRLLIVYTSESKSEVPAYLLVPKNALADISKYPAVLALHSTEAKLGHKLPVGLGGPEHAPYGHELAERGYVVIAPAYPQMANYWPDLKALGYRSGTMKAIWDNSRAIDLLESLPYVKRGGVGAIGHSLGGHNAIYTAVFDARIKVIVSSCGFDSYLDYMNGNISGWTQERYMPRLKDYSSRLSEIPFDFHELLGALAPRVVFVSAPKGDSNFKWESVDRIASAARPIYALYGKPNALRIEHPDCAHDFPEAMRKAAYEVLDREFK